MTIALANTFLLDYGMTGQPEFTATYMETYHKVFNILLSLTLKACCNEEISTNKVHLFGKAFGNLILITYAQREHSGSVVECLTVDRGAVGSSLTGITVLWSLNKTHLS